MATAPGADPLVGPDVPVEMPGSPPGDAPASDPGADLTPAVEPGGTEEVPSEACVASTNNPPLAPRIMQPAAGSVGVLPAELAIVASAFEDPDGDAHAASDIEIWRERQGELESLVWSAKAGSGVSSVRLVDGEFSEGAPDGLLPWTRYAVRARYRDDDLCPRASAWSEAVGFRTDDGSAYLFAPDTVRAFSLDIPPSSWAAINAQAIPPGCLNYQRQYYPAALSFEGQEWKGVGLRVKGGCGSARDLSQKAAFKVNLEWDDPMLPGCPDERRLYGESHFTFNNAVQDQSFAHEALGYAYFRGLGLPAPRIAHVRLYVNGQYWGVYIHIESIDRRFLRRWFGSNRGMMYEGAYFCDLVPENVPATDSERTCLTPEFHVDACGPAEPGDDPSGYALARDLVGRIQAVPVGQFYSQVKAFFEFDRFLLQWAADSVVGHWDSYEDWGRSNYRVYHDPSTDKWTIIETGIDQTFVEDNDPFKVKAVLAERCLAEPDCEAAFVERLRIATDAFEAMHLEDEAQRIYDRIAADVAADPRKGFDEATFASAHASLRAWILARPAFMRDRLQLLGY